MLEKIVTRIQWVWTRAVKKYYFFQVKRRIQTSFRPCPICENIETFTPIWNHDRYLLPIKTQRCHVCGLVFVNPTPSEEFIKEFYSSKQYRGMYLGILNASENNNDKSYQKAKKNFLFISTHTSLPEQAQILDIGSAFGGYLLEMKKNNRRYDIYAVEPGINFAKKHRGAFAGFYRSIDEIPTKKKFDLITMWHVLEHIYNPVDYLKKVRLLLSPVGVLIIEVPNMDKYTGIVNIHIGHLFHFNPETIAKLAQAAGFIIVHISSNHLEDERFGMKVILKPTAM